MPDSVEQLARWTTLELGGPARRFVRIASTDELLDVVHGARRAGTTVRVLGGGSNLVVADEGVGDDLVVKLDLKGVTTHRNGQEVEITARAGEVWDDVVASCVDQGWAGVECLSGIPGSVGAAPMQNIGAYGQEVGETLVHVDALDCTTGRIERLQSEQCELTYRRSRFKARERGRWILLSVTLRLRAGGAPCLRYPDIVAELGAARPAAPSLRETRDAILAVRARKSMVIRADDENRRSCGSFFLNPIVEAAAAERVAEISGQNSAPLYPQPDGRVKIPAAWLIEATGFAKGLRRGNVGLSTRHSLAIVAHAGARTTEVIALALEIRRAVEDLFGVRLHPEPDLWGFPDLEDGLPRP
jgi:UDP-N-acetylmuramate dehydrogenase